MRLTVDTNVLIDFAIERKPFSEASELLMALGYLGELELWVGTSQISDLIYVITEGGKVSCADAAKDMMRKLRSILHIYATNEEDYDAVAASTWTDLEDAFVFQTALQTKSDAIITRDAKGFSRSPIRTLNCEELFALLEEQGFAYAFTELNA